MNKFHEGDRVMVLTVLDRHLPNVRSPAFSGPAVVTSIAIADDCYSVNFVPELLPDSIPDPRGSGMPDYVPKKHYKIRMVVHESCLQHIVDGMTLTYPDIGLQWSSRGVEKLGSTG